MTDLVPPSTIRLGIGLPAYGAKLSMWHAQMWLTLGATLAQSPRFDLAMFSYVDACGIDVARNRLVEDALKARCDWLLMVDADAWTDDGGALLQMIADADRYGEDPQRRTTKSCAIVGAPVPRRDPNDTRPTVYRRITAHADRAPLLDMPFAYEPIAVSGDRLVEVDSIGAAMVAVNLNFLALTVPPWFKFLWKPGETRPHRSEDHVLCERAIDCGWAVLADPRVVTHHLQRPRVETREVR